MTNDTQQPSQLQRFAHWRAVVLVGGCIGAGLVLDMQILTSGPDNRLDAAMTPTTVVAEVVANDTSTVPTVPAVSASAPLPTTAALEPLPTTTVPPVAAAPVEQLAAVAPLPPSSPAPVSVTQNQGKPTPSPSPAAAAVTTPSPPTTAPAAPPPTAPPPTAPPPTAALAPPPTAPPTTSPPTTSPPTTGPPTTSPLPAAAAAASVTYPSYEVPDVADVVLAFADETTITVWSVAPKANWVYEVENNGPRTIAVKFFNVQTHREATFQAEVEGNRIKVESED
jgi:hypothetical protein